MQSHFDYVLFHFRRVYDLPAQVEITYGTIGNSRVQIIPTQDNFFARQQPQPTSIVWEKWQGTQLPLFFDPSPDATWFTKNTAGQVIVHIDLIANSFYLLSGWQEYYSSERDQFDRFPYRASVQAAQRFITKPIVNYYFDILKQAIESAYGIDIPLRTWQGKPFATCLTHDIDYIQSAWKVAGKPALHKGDLFTFLRLADQRFSGKDAWFNLGQVENELRELGAPGTFFFLPESRKYGSHPNADYDISAAEIRSEIHRLRRNHHETGIHGSHGSGASANQLKQEKEKFREPVAGNRFHYLRYFPKQSLHVLEASNFLYDTSLGFPEHFGFRNSFCHPFRLYDFESNRMSDVWELPLNLMDITLHHPNYLQVLPIDALPAIAPMLEEIRKFNGVFTLLWHNENFTAYGLPQGLEIFRGITRFVKEADTLFLTCQQAVKG